MELIGPLRRREFLNAGVLVRYLGEAEYDRFQQTVAEFRPSLVHMVCHGHIRGKAPPEILLLERLPDPSGKKRTWVLQAGICHSYVTLSHICPCSLRRFNSDELNLFHLHPEFLRNRLEAHLQ
jgi:hypothetical protein